MVKTIHFPEKKKRTRLVVKKGAENISIPLENIVFFHTEIRSCLLSTGMVRNMLRKKVSPCLNQNLIVIFFSVRTGQYIINIGHVKSFRAYKRVKLKVDMNSDELNNKYFIIISQETAPAFRKWIYAA